MKIGISTLAVNRDDFGGGERYLYYLLHNIAELDHENEYFVFTNSQNQNKFTINQKNFRIIVCPIYNGRLRRILYEQIVLPKLLKNYRIDIFHNPNNILPLRLPCKSVVTIQYMFSFLMPQDYSPFYRRGYFNTLMKFSARKANKVISVSNDNKHQIVNHLGIPAHKVTTIYHGLDLSFTRVESLDHIELCKAKYRINREYILCVANNVLNKNLEGLIEAFNYIKKKYNIPHKLVIAGNTGFSRQRQFWLREIKDKYPDIVHTGYIDHKELPNLYSGADIFVLPSYCESFGFPLLEAMACGVPVITSNIYAMPEVVGDAGLLVNPYDTVEIGEAIYSLLANETLKKELIKKGLKRVRLFTWEKAAKDTLKIFEEVYNS